MRPALSFKRSRPVISLAPWPIGGQTQLMQGCPLSLSSSSPQTGVVAKIPKFGRTWQSPIVVEKLRGNFVEAHTLPIRAECSVKEQSWNILYDSPASVI